MRAYIQQRWSGLQSRERSFVLVGGPIIAAILVYGLIFSPLANQAKEAKQALSYKQDLRQWMQTHVTELLQLRRQKPSSNAKTKPLIIMERELAGNTLSSYNPQIKQGKNDEVQVTFVSVPFDETIKWLGQLQQRHGLRIVAFNASKLDQPGMVKLSLSLQ